MNFEITTPSLSMFVQGLFGFFTPCVIPIIPLYIVYLSAGSLTSVLEDDEIESYIEYNHLAVLINTLFFVLGISCAFLVLALSFSKIGQYLLAHQTEFRRIGGIFILLLGIMQSGAFDAPPSTLNGSERRLSLISLRLQMNPIIALVMGFVLSFSWTPSVGPTLTSVLITVSMTGSMLTGLLMMTMYTLGFSIPFLIIGLILTFYLYEFDRNKTLAYHTTKATGAILVFMGIFMITGLTDQLDTTLEPSNYALVDQIEIALIDALYAVDEAVEDIAEGIVEGIISVVDFPQEEHVIVSAREFDLIDQYGFGHTLEQYEGKTIFLNFLASWCDPAVYMMAEVQELYETYGYNAEDIIVLGIVAPQTEQNPDTEELDLDDMLAFINNKTTTYPIMLDVSGAVTRSYMLDAYPATVMIDSRGDVFGYVPDTLTLEMMVHVIDQTVAHNEANNLIEYLPAWREDTGEDKPHRLN